MIPTKLENHIKNKLFDREITPSSVAWDNLSSQIKSNQKENKTNYFKYAIVASILVLFGVGVYFVSVNKLNSDELIIVEKQQKVPEKTEAVIQNIGSPVSSEILVVEKGKSNAVYLQNKLASVNTSVLSTKSVSVLRDEINQDGVFIERQLSFKEDSLIDSKITQVFTAVNTLQKDNKILSDQDVDALLRQAQIEILAERQIFNSNKNNAMALLLEAEQELDASFKEQIFLSLKQKFLKIKTAVAARNN